MAQPQPNACSMCHKPEGAGCFGNYYDAISANGMRLLHFWVCNDCAIPLGPGQGGVVADPEQQPKKI